MEWKEEMDKWIEKSKVDVRQNIKIRMYLNTGSQMLQQANIYRKENDIINAYFLYIKYVSLHLEALPKHPEFPTISKPDKSLIKENVKLSLREAEIIRKPVLEHFEKKHLEQKERPRTAETDTVPSSSKPEEKTGFDFGLNEPTAFFNGGLRKILVPSSMIPKFLQLVKQNTNNNVETCGLLTGILQRNCLIITLLIIPEQTGSSDHCAADNELDSYLIIDQRGLLSLGWIHTHPSQKSFLSSVDLHNQFGYQVLIPEALAIVCAPKYSNDIFRLTDMGRDVVGKCTERGFHPHSQSPLFENAAHAEVVDIPFEIIDLRK